MSFNLHPKTMQNIQNPHCNRDVVIIGGCFYEASIDVNTFLLSERLD
ncbi:hypothetical protein FB556_1138 [Enteractinococcus coprophilus]|uniref:Uncharacterized protein n=1 Tax=Enteractinococcus coprophilus TaxID=1027633 RepID=A0A543AIT1_9MICC|nr:hypothetical protein FB556_1138 [Enteractinococcus coprophilus]